MSVSFCISCGNRIDLAYGEVLRFCNRCGQNQAEAVGKLLTPDQASRITQSIPTPQVKPVVRQVAPARFVERVNDDAVELDDDGNTMPTEVPVVDSISLSADVGPTREKLKDVIYSNAGGEAAKRPKGETLTKRALMKQQREMFKSAKLKPADSE